MLKSVDVLIGFSVIMLVVSMSVTLIIQWIVHLLGMRGKELLKGLTALLNRIDPELLTPEHAGAIATRILTHPMLARSGEKLAGVVQREELIKTVLEIAAGAAAQLPQPDGSTAGGTAPSTAPPAPTNLPLTAEQALAKALVKLGIANPGNALDAIRMLSMRLEASRPDLATHVREATAVIAKAESQFVAKVNGWFDPTMDRVSQSFTYQSRYWTAGVSLVLALLLQIDAFKIVNRLSIDDSLRAKLVDQAQTVTTSNNGQANAPAPQGATGDEQTKKLEEDTQANVTQLRLLASDKLVTWPDGWDNWKKAWGQSSVFGVLLSAALLSFGAPFWFNMLGDLLKLRPMLASKDDKQRQERETTQPPPDDDGSPPSPLTAVVALTTIHGPDSA